MTNPTAPTPKRGEVWWVRFDPTVGSEINKTRPAVVISSDAIGKLAVKIVVPLTKWNDDFVSNIWHVSVTATSANGLEKNSTADALQTKSVAIERFETKAGRLTESQLDEITRALAAVVELPP